MSPTTLGCALSAAVLSVLAVAGHRIGLALAVVALLVLAVAVRSGPAVRGRWPLAVAGAGLAVQPALRDAGWLVADLPGVLLAAGAIVVPPVRWPLVARAVLAPLRMPTGPGWLGRAGAAELGGARRAALVPVLRGVALGAGALLVFGALFLSADPAFADFAERRSTSRWDPATCCGGSSSASGCWGPRRPWRWRRRSRSTSTGSAGRRA